MSECFLLLGTNLGNRKLNLQKSLKALENKAGTISHISAVYETEPWGFEAETAFLNMAIRMKTAFSPLELLRVAKEIEQQMGRTETTGNGYTSRPMDIDILFFNNEVINVENLTIPHPLLAERKFALLPLFEICPEYVHPILGITVSELLDKCTDEGKVTKWSNNKSIF